MGIAAPADQGHPPPANSWFLEVPCRLGLLGAGAYGTVVSALRAPSGTQLFAAIQTVDRLYVWKLPFHEKNLTELSSVTCARAGGHLDRYSSREGEVIFLAEISSFDLAIRIARAAAQTADSAIVTPVPVGTASAIEQNITAAGLRATLASQPTLTGADRGFQLADRIHPGTVFGTTCTRSQTNIPLTGGCAVFL